MDNAYEQFLKDWGIEPGLNTNWKQLVYAAFYVGYHCKTAADVNALAHQIAFNQPKG